MGSNRGEYKKQSKSKICRLVPAPKALTGKGELFEIWVQYCEKRYLEGSSPLDAVKNVMISYDALTYLSALGLEALTDDLFNKNELGVAEGGK